MDLINLFSSFTKMTGFGITGINVWKNLRKRIDLSCIPIGSLSFDSEKDYLLMNQDLKNTIASNSKTAPCLKIWRLGDLISRVGSGRYGVYTFFELDKINSFHIGQLDHADVVFTPSKWSKQILLNNKLDTSKIIICHPGVDKSTFNPSNFINLKNGSNYIFLHIGKWQKRKGHDFLINAFNKAFSSKDKVELWMMSENPFLTKKETEYWHRMYKSGPLRDKIKILSRVDTHRELANIISQSDCGIYPSRGEGWNYSIPDTMSMNRPIITTNYSAHTEYCSKKNSYLIDIDNLEPAVDQNEKANWAELKTNQLEQTIHYMRHVYTNKIRTNTEGLKTSARFTWNKTADVLFNNLINV
jgi:glycosyltransferase involved in cell wall biosynthesis